MYFLHNLKSSNLMAILPLLWFTRKCKSSFWSPSIGREQISYNAPPRDSGTMVAQSWCNSPIDVASKSIFYSSKYNEKETTNLTPITTLNGDLAGECLIMSFIYPSSFLEAHTVVTVINNWLYRLFSRGQAIVKMTHGQTSSLIYNSLWPIHLTIFVSWLLNHRSHTSHTRVGH